jgi:DNA repair protein RadC
VRHIARRALSLNAHALILAHNHPHGASEPSPTDVRSTIELQSQLLPLGVHLLDHFIVADGQTPFSMVENHLITNVF